MANLRSDNRWILAVTAPQRERWAGENIKRQKHEYFFPIYRDVRVQRGKKIEVVKPLFPRYIFVSISDRWRFLTGTFGVTGIVMNGEVPAVVPLPIVKELQQYKSNPVDLSIKEGDPVQVTAGAFSGFVGKFVSMSEAEDRIKVLLSIFGRETPVEVESVRVA